MSPIHRCSGSKLGPRRFDSSSKTGTMAVALGCWEYSGIPTRAAPPEWYPHNAAMRAAGPVITGHLTPQPPRAKGKNTCFCWLSCKEHPTMSSKACLRMLLTLCTSTWTVWLSVARSRCVTLQAGKHVRRRWCASCASGRWATFCVVSSNESAALDQASLVAVVEPGS